MSDSATHIAASCPACGGETVHEVLKPGGQATVRCTDCGHTHKTSVEPVREVDLDVVVSQDGESFATTLQAPAEETVALGEEFLVDTPEAILQVRATSIDIGDERRVEEAMVEEVETVWTRVVDNVSVDVTIHPKEGDGRHHSSRSVAVRVPGDYEFTVGEVESMGDEEFEVVGVKLRTDATGYDFEKLDHDGDVALAKDVTRVYGRDTTSSAWSAW